MRDLILGTVNETTTQETQLVVKAIIFGPDDVRDAVQAAPYGVDSNPINEIAVIYTPTTNKGDEVMLGYLNKNVLAQVGEIRLFATDADGAVQGQLWLRNDGKICLGGTGSRTSLTKHATQYEALETAFNSLKTTVDNLVTKHNAFLTEYKSHVHTGVTTGAGSSGTTVSTQTNANAPTADISGAKLNNILTE